MRPDQPLTLAVAIIGAILTIALPRKWALLPLAVSMFWQPCVLLMPPPQLSLTAQRFIAVVLLFRCLLNPDIRSQFKWRLVDSAVVFYFICVTSTLFINAPDFGKALTNRLGFFLSAILPYFCARLLLTDREKFFAAVKGILFAAAPLAVMGMIEMQTAWNPWDRVRDLGMLGPLPRKTDGFRIFMGSLHARARGPFVQYIMFGWFFAIVMAISTSLYFHRNRLRWWVIPWLMLPMGVISSIASGPMMLVGMALGLSILFPLRRYWKIGFWTAVILFVTATGYSNRTPMQMIASFGFDPNSSWYRYKLVRYVLDEGGMKGHWFSGYGEIPWHFDHVHDLCIHWVWLLVIHGIVGMVGFYAMISALGWTLWKAREKANSLADQYLLWSFMATLVGSLGAMLVVALFSEMYYIYHFALGIMANAPLYVGASQAAGLRHVGVLAQVDGKPVMLRYSLKPGQRLALVQHVPDAQAKPLEEEQGTVDARKE